MKIQQRSAAKVNLTLDILSRRTDGYHELASVVHTIGIWDEIEVERTAVAEIRFSCNQEELSGADNLCVRAAKKWQEAANQAFGLEIHLEKRIPTGAGLGGGSGNAAAILLALNRISQVPLPSHTLREIGAKLGADVPLFLEGGAVLMEGIGDKIKPLTPKIAWLVVVKPRESFATPQIYQLWDEQNRFSGRATPQMLKNWHRDSIESLAQSLGNDLQLAAGSISTLPRVCSQLLRDCGAKGAQMSGSGSACFGLFRTQNDAQVGAEKLKFELAKDVHLQTAQIFVAPFCERGVDFTD